MGEFRIFGLSQSSSLDEWPHYFVLDVCAPGCAAGVVNTKTFWRKAWDWLGVGCWVLIGTCVAAENKLLNRAVELWKAGEHTNALVLVNKAVVASPRDTRVLSFRAQVLALLGRRTEALADLTAALAMEPKSAWLLHERGEHRFRAGDFAGACADFGKADELSPERAAHDWQRGIALYYAGHFAEGRKLFELHRTVNPQDVEISAWHFLCAAREDGLEKASAGLIPVKADSRVPMREVQGLFGGQNSEAEVFQAAESGAESARPGQRFYAYLYVGLYHEAAGHRELAMENIRKAAALARHGGYMGEVARVHALQFDTANPLVKPSAAPPTTSEK